MAYKARFQPLEQLTPGGWRPMSAEQTLAADAVDQGPGAV
jgi:arginyl-tRNA--protein-N-Asp/Glu arginylyltransferase